MVIFFRHGPENPSHAGGFSWFTYNFVVMPQFDVSICDKHPNKWMAHEIGHFLGLFHTFSEVFETREDAVRFFNKHEKDPQIFDGDGLDDTMPDPHIRSNVCTSNGVIEISGETFELPLSNIMAYYGGDQLTTQQIDKARKILRWRIRNQMQMASNTNTINPIELEELNIISSEGVEIAVPQEMNRWASSHWSGRKQLFIAFKPDGLLKVELPVKETGLYNIIIFGTHAPDYCMYEIRLDEKLLITGDAYSPVVLATGAISIGKVELEAGNHILEIKCIGKNEDSSGYKFGIDAIELTKIEEE